MDIEGSELPALKGGLKTIQQDRPQLAFLSITQMMILLISRYSCTKTSKIIRSGSVITVLTFAKQFYTLYRMSFYKNLCSEKMLTL